MDTLHPYYQISKNNLLLFLKEALESARLKDPELMSFVLEDVFNTFTNEVNVESVIDDIKVSNQAGNSVLLTHGVDAWCVDDGGEPVEDVEQMAAALAFIAYPIQ